MLEFKHINLSFGEQNIFSDLNFKIEKGEKVVLQGESGKGKSCLLKMILGFLQPNSGEIIFNGVEITERTKNTLRTNIAWMPQEAQFNFPSLYELIKYPFTFEQNKKFTPSKKEIEGLSEKFMLKTEVLQQSTAEVSGGQKQRAVLISCLLLNRPLLLLDEPTSALDEASAKAVIDYLISMSDVGFLVSSHHPYFAQKADRIIKL